jgi:hypothetical protein
MDTAVALAGIGGNNAHGGGFLAAAQDYARRNGNPDGLLPGLKMITCTSGAIASTATYLQGGDLRAETAKRVGQVDRVTPFIPREEWADPIRLPYVLTVTGLPGVFGPYWQAVTEQVVARSLEWMSQGRLPWASPQALTETFFPARLMVPRLKDAWFEATATTLAKAAVGIAFNSFDITAGIEYLYVNEPGMDLIAEHHDPSADFGARHQHTVYERITPDAVREALWLLWYGFDKPNPRIDGCYARSIILNELTFADRIFAVKGINDHWIGPPPRTMFEALDLQTEFWMESTYRQQRHQLELINDLVAAGRLTDPKAGVDGVAGKKFHTVDLRPVEIETQRGMFAYFLESLDVFDAARAQSEQALAEAYDGDRAAVSSGPSTP